MEDDNQKNTKKEQGPKRPFYMVEPDSVDSEFVKINADGTYEINVQFGLSNPTDKNKYAVVRFVNGKQLPGVITLGQDDTTLSYAKVKAGANGDIRVGLALASNQDENSGVSLVIPRSKLGGGVKPQPDKSSRIHLQVGYPNQEREHTVQINLFTTSGDPEEGKVEISAGQKFEVDGAGYTGRHEIDVPANGLNIIVKPLERNERFKFTFLGCGSSVTEQLLAKK